MTEISDATPPRQLIFLVDSLEELSRFPLAVKRSFGQTLWALQIGAKPQGDITKLQGLSSVYEIRKEVGDAYRVIYCAIEQDTLYILHAFKKKSSTGSKTPMVDSELIASRYKMARERIRKGLDKE